MWKVYNIFKKKTMVNISERNLTVPWESLLGRKSYPIWYTYRFSNDYRGYITLLIKLALGLGEDDLITPISIEK